MGISQTKGGKKGKTATQVNQVVAGLGEALQEMCVGDRFEVYVPTELAYGTRADKEDKYGQRPFSLKKGPSQPPGYSPLVIDVRLLSVKDKGKPCVRGGGEL